MVEKKISDNELKEWGEKNFPDYAGNMELMRMCWEREQGITYPLKIQGGYIKKKVNEIKEGEFVEIKVLIAKTRDMKYNGCIKCKKKIQDGQNLCSKCGCNDFMVYNWKYYSAGDNTGTIIIKALYPNNEGVEVFKNGKTYIIKGRVNRNDRNNRFELMVKGNNNNGKPKLNTDLEKANNAVLDYLDVFQKGIGEGKLREWIKEQDFKVGFDEIMGSIKVRNENGIITLIKGE